MFYSICSTVLDKLSISYLSPLAPFFFFDQKKVDGSSVVFLRFQSILTRQFRHNKAPVLGKLGNVIDTDVTEVKCLSFSKGPRV